MQFRMLDTNYLIQAATTLTASSSDIVFPVNNLTLQSRSKIWRSAATVTDANVVIDLGAVPLGADTIAFFWDPLRSVPLTPTATVTVQANATNVWTTPSISIVLPIGGAYGSSLFTWATPQTYRYWRIRVQDAGNPNLRVELSKVYLGQATQMTRLPDDSFVYERADHSKTTENDYGHQYIDIYPQKITLKFTWKAISYVDAQALEALYQRAGIFNAIVVSLDPDESLFNSRHFLVYGRITKPLGLVQISDKYFTAALEIKEAF